MFYGWKICLLTTLGNFVLQGSVIFMMNAFMEPMSALHGWSRAQISLGMSIAALLGALTVPLWAAFSLRFSIRLSMTVGAAIGALSLMGIGFTSNLYIFYLCYTLAWASGQAFGGPTAQMLLNQWFSRFKGKAFGISNSGTSIAGATMPFILMLVILQFDVQTAWIAYGAFILCLAPLCWFIIRDTPQMMDLHVDNDPRAPEESIQCVHTMTLWSVLKQPPAIMLGLIFGLSLLAGGAVVGQLKPRLVDVGLDDYTAMLISCATAAFLAIAKYSWGIACDRFNPILILRVLVTLIFISLGLIFLPPSLPILLLFCAMFGITLGGIWVVLPVCVAFYFGKENFICYYRVISVFVLLKAVGFTMMGISHHYTHSYDAAYIAFEGVYFICIILSFLLKTDPKKDKYLHAMPQIQPRS